MKELIERSYLATIKRGCINDKTTPNDFIAKIDEELTEASELVSVHGEILYLERYVEELTDIAAVCFNQIRHLGLDPIKEFEKVVIKNETRED